MSYRVRIENGDFWTDDNVVILFVTADKTVEAIDEFLIESAKAGFNYVEEDIEVVTQDGSVLTYDQIFDLAVVEGSPTGESQKGL